MAVWSQSREPPLFWLELFLCSTRTDNFHSCFSHVCLKHRSVAFLGVHLEQSERSKVLSRAWSCISLERLKEREHFWFDQDHIFFCLLLQLNLSFLDLVKLTWEESFVGCVHNSENEVSIKLWLSIAFYLWQVALADWMAHRVIVNDPESETFEARNVDRSHLFVSVHRYRARQNGSQII